jgi:hypothetical protein
MIPAVRKRAASTRKTHDDDGDETFQFSAIVCRLDKDGDKESRQSLPPTITARRIFGDSSERDDRKCAQAAKILACWFFRINTIIHTSTVVYCTLQ